MFTTFVVAVQPGLDRSVTHAIVDFVRSLVIGADGQELGLDEVRHHPSPIFDDSNWLIISPEMVNDR
jgi:hypothetical protein